MPYKPIFKIRYPIARYAIVFIRNSQTNVGAWKCRLVNSTVSAYYYMQFSAMHVYIVHCNVRSATHLYK